MVTIKAKSLKDARVRKSNVKLSSTQPKQLTHCQMFNIVTNSIQLEGGGEMPFYEENKLSISLKDEDEAHSLGTSLYNECRELLEKQLNIPGADVYPLVRHYETFDPLVKLSLYPETRFLLEKEDGTEEALERELFLKQRRNYTWTKAVISVTGIYTHKHSFGVKRVLRALKVKQKMLEEKRKVEEFDFIIEPY